MKRSILVTVAVFVLLGAARAAAAPRHFTTRSVPFEHHRLYLRDYRGAGPPVVLMHGFPDDLHLYDRLVPKLRGRRTIAFDFLGWGRSDKPRGHVYTFAEQEREVAAVVRRLHLRRIVVVVHDASGPAGINWSLDHPGAVARLVILNTFYSPMPTMNAPQAIRIYSQPEFAPLARAIARDDRINKWLYYWQVGRFMSNRKVRARTLRRFWPIFRASLPAFVSLNKDLRRDVAANAAREPELRRFRRPVRIIWGARDPYLNKGMARSFHELLPTSELFLLPARHYVQVDRPRSVARLILRK